MDDELTSVDDERDLGIEVIPGSRPPHWWIAGILVLMVLDMAAPNWLGVCVLHLIVLPLAWRFMHRRFITLVSVTQAATVAIAGLWHVFFGPLGSGWPIKEIGVFFSEVGTAHSVSMLPLDPVRLWTFGSLLAAWYFHLYLRKRLLQRIRHQHLLQQNIRRRSQELKQVNYALRDEVARRQATQHRLDQSETTFQSLMDRMHLQVARKNAEGVFTYANQPFCKEIGLNPIDVIGSTDADLYSPAIATRYRADDMRVMTTGHNVDKVEEHPGVDGQSGFVQVFKAPEYDQHGQCIGVQVIFWDITEKHRNEIALRHSEARKRALFDAAGDAVLLVDETGVIMEANPSASELLQAGGGRLVGRPLEHLVMPVQINGPLKVGSSAPREEAKPGVANVGKDQLISWSGLPLSQRHELRLRRGDGVAFESEVSIHVIPLGNQSGSNVRSRTEGEGRAVIIRDVTLQQQAFEAMREAKAEAEQANRTKTQFMAGISHELRTPLGGIRGLTELLGKQTLPATARRYVSLIAQNTELLYDAIEDILDFSAIEAGRVAIAPAPIDLHETVGDAFGCLAIRVANAPVRLCLSIAPNVPRYVMADAKRIRQIIVNLVGNGIKFTPSGEVSLRMTAMSSDQPGTDSKTEPPIQPEPPSQTAHPFQIVVEDTGIGIAPENCNRIFDAFEQGDRGTNKKFGGTGLGLAIARGLAQRMGGGIQLESELGKGSRFVITLSLPLVDDPNLVIEQANWQTESPTESSMNIENGSGHHRGLVVLSVGNDSIHQSLVETITSEGFEAATPATVAASQARSVVRWILTNATADEAFRFRARKSDDHVLWLTHAGETSPRRAKKQDQITIEPVRPDELRRWLSGLPLRPSFPTPELGYASSFADEPDHRVDALLGQTGLSGQTGLPRQTGLPGPPLVDSIGTPQSSTHARSISTSGRSILTSGLSVSPGGRSVLVVDDSPTNRLVIHDQLVAAGHRVETAHLGSAAIELFQQTHLSGRHRFDCILMDLQMPEMDGTEVTKEIRKMCREASVECPPIIALTAHVTDHHRQLCRDAGMVGYVTKPIHIDPLLQEIDKAIVNALAEKMDRGKPDRGKPDTEKTDTERDDAKEHTREITSSQPESDQWLERLGKHCGGDESTMQSVCEAIKIEIPDLIRRLDRAAKQGKQRDFKTAAHTIKSCLRYVADPEDIRIASEIEKACDDEQWMARLAADYGSVTQGPEFAQLNELQRRAKDWAKRVANQS